MLPLSIFGIKLSKIIEANQIYHSVAFDGIHLFIYETIKDLLSYETTEKINWVIMYS